MQEENQNPEAELETTQTSKETTEETETVNTEESKKDPLDEMSPEEVRAEAKKLRAIAARANHKKPEPQSTQDFVTKRDLEVRYEEDVKESFTTISETDSEDIKSMKQDFIDNYKDISTYYVNREGRESAKQIEKDMRRAYILWKDENSSNGTEALSTIVVNKSGGSGKPTEQTKPESDPRFSTPKSPKDWYKK